MRRGTEIPRPHTKLQQARISLKINTVCNVVGEQAILETSELDVCVSNSLSITA